jgi:hypothetical protein
MNVVCRWASSVRNVSVALLTIGIATPVGPLLSGYLIEHTGQTLTFIVLAAVVAGCTIAMQLSTAIRSTLRHGNYPAVEPAVGVGPPSGSRRAIGEGRRTLTRRGGRHQYLR